MFALISAWAGLICFLLSLTMVFWRPAFHDALLPVALYGAVAAIGCGGIVFMRKRQVDDIPEAIASQQMQARVGIGLGMIAVVIVYALMAMAQRVKA